MPLRFRPSEVNLKIGFISGIVPSLVATMYFLSMSEFIACPAVFTDDITPDQIPLSISLCKFGLAIQPSSYFLANNRKMIYQKGFCDCCGYVMAISTELNEALNCLNKKGNYDCYYDVPKLKSAISQINHFIEFLENNRDLKIQSNAGSLRYTFQ